MFLAKLRCTNSSGGTLQIKDRVRHQRDAINIFQPRLVHAAHHVARHQRVNVAIRQDDEAGLKRGQNDVLQLVRKIGRVKQAQRGAAQNVAFLGAAPVPR